MTLNEWFQSVDVNPENALFVSMATDGLSTQRDNSLAISLMNMDLKINRTLFIQGAQVEKVYQYTGIGRHRYEQEKMGWRAVQEELASMIKPANFFVSYMARTFTKPWLIKQFPEIFRQRTLLDIVELIKFQDNFEEDLPQDAHNIRELSEALDSSTSILNSKGYSLPELYRRFNGKSLTDLSETEKKNYYVRHLFQSKLMI
jgi:hypothetical protein